MTTSRAKKMKQVQRNFVAKNMKSAGSGFHKDKKYNSKNGITKHKGRKED